MKKTTQFSVVKPTLLVISVLLVFLCGIIQPEYIMAIQIVLLLFAARKVRISQSFIALLLILVLHTGICVLLGRDTIFLAVKQLADATVQFSYNKESYKPFDGWTPNSKPSWWGDYNKVKHNRAENDNIKLANLKNVFNALAALFILNRYLCKIVCSNKIMKEPEIKSNLFTMVGWDICILEGNGFVRRLSTNGNMSVLVES